jgi:F5/8 type C domain
VDTPGHRSVNRLRMRSVEHLALCVSMSFGGVAHSDVIGSYHAMHPPGWAELRRVGLIVSLLFILAACSAGGDGGAEVSGIDEILVRPIEVVDLTGGSATLQAETTIPVACSVVYGLDENYGQQSTDTDMAGGGHSVHHPLLGNLEPETVYHYRLLGAGPDGTLYRSEDMTFETPPASEQQSLVPDGRNVASAAEGGQIVEFSSEFGPGWAAANAVDGDPATEWSSAGDGNDAFITVEFSAPTELEAIGIWTRTMGSSAQIESFQVVTDAGEVLGPFDVPDAGMLHTYPVNVTADTLRFEVITSSGGNTGLVELVAIAAN